MLLFASYCEFEELSLRLLRALARLDCSTSSLPLRGSGASPGCLMLSVPPPCVLVPGASVAKESDISCLLMCSKVTPHRLSPLSLYGSNRDAHLGGVGFKKVPPPL